MSRPSPVHAAGALAFGAPGLSAFSPGIFSSSRGVSCLSTCIKLQPDSAAMAVACSLCCCGRQLEANADINNAQPSLCQMHPAFLGARATRHSELTGIGPANAVLMGVCLCRTWEFEQHIRGQRSSERAPGAGSPGRPTTASTLARLPAGGLPPGHRPGQPGRCRQPLPQAGGGQRAGRAHPPFQQRPPRDRPGARHGPQEGRQPFPRGPAVAALRHCLLGRQRLRQPGQFREAGRRAV